MSQTPESQQQYGSILTILGENAEQNGKLQNKQITFTHMAIGDANDQYVQPDRKQTALVNELARIPVNSVDVLQPTPDSVPMLKVEAILPDDINDLVIREFAAVATFDGNAYFHAVGNNARIYVPPPVNNGNVSTPVTLEMIFVITSAAPIVEIDPNVVTASRSWVNEVENKLANTQNLNPGFISGTELSIKNVPFTGAEQAIRINNPSGSDLFFHLRDKPSAGDFIEQIDIDGKKCVINGEDYALITIPERYALDLYATQPEEIHVWEYMIGRSFSEAQQMAIDAAEAIVSSTTAFDKASATIIWPRGIFVLDYPGLVYNPDGIRFKGQGKFSTQFVPGTNMVHPNLPQKWKDLPDSYDSPALLIFARRRQTGGPNGDFIPGGKDATPRYISVEDFSFMGRGSGFDKTISLLYGHGMSHVYMKGFYANGFKYVIDSSKNVYRCEVHDYELEHCVGFTNHPGGTTFENHNGGLTSSDEGWSLRKISYTTWNNVACDHWGKGSYGWDFEDCLQVNLIGCGMEKGLGGAFRFKGERCSVNVIGCNIASGSNPNQDNYEGQTTPQDFGVEEFSVIEGAVVNISSGCSIRQEFSPDGTLNNLQTFPVVVKDAIYGDNQNLVRGANVTVGALGDVYAATFDELFPSTSGQSQIKNLDPATAIEFVGVNDRVQSVGSDESYKLDFEPVDGRDKYSLWDDSRKLVELKHGGRIRVSFNGLVKGTGMNYVAISIAGKDSPLIKLDRDITTQDNVSYSAELNAVAGDVVSVIVRTYPGGSATIEPYARLNISYV